MTTPVSAGDNILPALTAAWYNDTLSPTERRVGVGTTKYRGNEIDCYLPSGTATRWEPMGLGAPLNHLQNKNCSLTTPTACNWVIPQTDMVATQVTPCVFVGATFAWVTIADANHLFVTVVSSALTTAEIGKGYILSKSSELSGGKTLCLIAIGPPPAPSVYDIRYLDGTFEKRLIRDCALGDWEDIIGTTPCPTPS